MPCLHIWTMFTFNIVYVNLVYLILDSSRTVVYLSTYTVKIIFLDRRLNVSFHKMWVYGTENRMKFVLQPGIHRHLQNALELQDQRNSCLNWVIILHWILLCVQSVQSFSAKDKFHTAYNKHFLVLLVPLVLLNLLLWLTGFVGSNAGCMEAFNC